MQIVIDIDDKLYKRIKYLEPRADTMLDELMRSVQNGTPLPKGHGDLIFKEQAIDLVEFYQLNPQHFDFVNLIDEIKDEKPIIEADTESEGKE